MACYSGFGNMREDRLLWTSNFVPWRGGVDILFYYPGDHNWWLGSLISNQLDWQLAGNTAGFGNLDDGRPIWIGDFTGTGGDDVLFYFPGDDNWWLGTFAGTSLSWQLVGNTAGFGNLDDGRPFWIGDFTGTGGDDVLFYYPGDDNWWLGTISGGSLSWQLVGNTVGFGNGIYDGRPFWIDDFNADARDDVLFYYPGDHNWWLGSVTGGSLTWTLVGNTAGFGSIWPACAFWTGYFRGVFRADVLFYQPGDGNWWLGTLAGSLGWALVGNTGEPFAERLRLHVKIVSNALPANLVNTSVQVAQQLFAGVDILLELASTENLTANPAVAPLATLNVGACQGKTTAQQNTLFGNRNNVGANDVVAYFITATTPGALNGCATHPGGRPGCVVTAIASNFTLAHELGHVLGLGHVPGENCAAPGFTPTRLMTGCGTGLLTGTPTITQGETSTMLGSGLTEQC